MSKPRGARIIGLGAYLPEKVMSNADFEKIVDTSDEWIYSRTGIRQRRIAAENEFPSTMGTEAAKAALLNAKLSPDDIDLILVATMSGDYPSPSTAALVQHQLKAGKAAAMDIQAACTGFVYALATAKAYIESGMAKNILVIAAEKMMPLMDYADRTTCVLFGDGASAAVVSSAGPGLSIGPVVMGSDGSLADLVIIKGGGSRHPATNKTLEEGLQYFRMNGKEVYKFAIRKAASIAQECLTAAGISAQELSWVVPHQANQRMMDAIAKEIHLPESKVYSVIEKYGNTSAAGIGIALTELNQKEKLSPGENILLNAFGGGMTWAAILLTKEE
ncbi:MAG: beta-ketoacyl-ACP synthase III [Parachlamydiales bacterium]